VCCCGTESFTEQWSLELAAPAVFRHVGLMVYRPAAGARHPGQPSELSLMGTDSVEEESHPSSPVLQGWPAKPLAEKLLNEEYILRLTF